MIFVTLELLQKGFGDSMVSDKELKLAVGLRIREIREALKMTREQFSEMCGLSTSFLFSVETGAKTITAVTLEKICTAAHVSPTYIIQGRESGYETDVVLEMLNELDPRAKGHAVRILKEYLDAVRESEKEKGK